MKKLLFLIFSVCLFIACDDNGATHTRASIISEDFVKARLKFPAEAEFNGDYRGKTLSDSTFIVYQKFDAKNAFGVRSTYVYRAKMVYLGGDWTETSNWTYNELIIENVSTGEKDIFYSPKQ